MTRTEIVERLARERRVETRVENIARQPLDANLSDLAQMVYLILLEYDEDKLADLWEHGQMQFFIARIIINQYRSTSSPFYKQIRKYASKAEEIDTVLR